MWFSPRRTIRAVIDAETRPNWMPVAVLAAIFNVVVALERGQLAGGVSASASVFPIAVGLMQFGFGIFISPFLLAIIGGWLGGQGDPQDLRQAVVWSYLPQAVAALPAIAILASLGSAHVDPQTASPGSVLLLLLWSALALGAGLWTIVLTVGGVAEAHRFSVGRAIGTFCILALPLFLLGLVAGLF
jgi:hypothetical protein